MKRGSGDQGGKELFLAHVFELAAPVELADEGGALAPVALDFDVNLQEDLHTEQFLQLFAGGGADFFEHCAAAANDDGFLAVALDVDGGADADQARALFEGVHQDGDGVGDFLARGGENFFAEELGSEETLRLVSEKISGKIRRGFGEMGDETVEQQRQAVAGERGDGDDSGEVALAGERVNERKESGLGNEVNLVGKQEARAAETAGVFEGSAVVGAERHAGIEQDGEDIDAVESHFDFFHHLAAERGVGLVQAGRVDEYDLSVGAVDDALDAIAGGLRMARDDGDFAADELIDERGLAAVGATEKGDEAGLEGHVRGHDNRWWVTGGR